jgi:hypothetical protein
VLRLCTPVASLDAYAGQLERGGERGGCVKGQAERRNGLVHRDEDAIAGWASERVHCSSWYLCTAG